MSHPPGAPPPSGPTGPTGPTAPPGTPGHGAATAPPAFNADVRERGASRDGAEQLMDRRLFMQLLVAQAPHDRDSAEIAHALSEIASKRGIASVIYADVNDPRGIGFLTWSEDPSHFVSAVRPLFSEAPLKGLSIRPEF